MLPTALAANTSPRDVWGSTWSTQSRPSKQCIAAPLFSSLVSPLPCRQSAWVARVGCSSQAPACAASQQSAMTAAAAARGGHKTLASAMAPGPLTAAFIKLLQQRTSIQHSILTATADAVGIQGSTPAAANGVSSGWQPQPGQQQHSADHVQQLLGYTRCLTSLLQPHQASLILYVCAKRQLQCDQQLLSGLVQRLQPQHLQQLPPAGLANAAWALAVLRINPEAAWLDAFYTATAAVYSSSSDSSSTGRSSSSSSNGGSSTSATEATATRPCCSSSGSSSSFAQFNRHQQVQLLWAAGRLQQHPPAAWLQGLLAALQPHMWALSPTELTNVMWGLAQAGYRPGRLWLGSWFLASTQSLACCSPGCLACQVASLGVLRVKLSSRRWLVQLQATVAQQLPAFQPQHIAALLCGLAKRRVTAPPHWLRLLVLRQLEVYGSSRAVRACAEVTEACSRDVAATVWALPILLHPTATEWASQRHNAALLQQLAAVSLPLLPCCGVGELVQLAVGFAQLGYYPGAHWLKTHENAVAQHRLPLTDVNRWRLQAALKRLWRDGR